MKDYDGRMVRISKVVGSTMEPHRQENMKLLSVGQKLHFMYETDNPVDPNAIKLFADANLEKEIGYVRKEIAQEFKNLGLVVDEILVNRLAERYGTYGANITIFGRIKDGAGSSIQNP